MSKIALISDIHGRREWLEVKEKVEQYDKVIFIGDYFDSKEKELLGYSQQENFKEIIQFKKDNMDKVELLIGNHEFHYFCREMTYSGFQYGEANDIEFLIRENMKYLKLCVLYDDIMFSHAGISNIFCLKFGIDFLSFQELEFKINNIIYNDYRILQVMGKSGDTDDSSPIWIRPENLYKTAIPYLNQAVGHTSCKEPSIIAVFNEYKNVTNTLYFCDSYKYYTVIENGLYTPHLYEKYKQ